MKKKILFSVLALAVVAVVAGTAAAVSMSQRKSDKELLTMAGEINGAYIRGEYGDGTPLYKSGNISISAAEVLSMSKVLDISNTKDSARTAVETLLRREALAWAAVYAGYTATDEEVWAYLNNEREQFAEASNRDGFLIYLSAAKLTEDEYWQFQFDTRRATFVSGKHLEAEREAFFA
ncbi:MAG: hypothetical protein LBI44_05245, partial [Oscillospiraceae bacterium]|nr:hypothetical protein [Oscillospiraceae bacterium]